MARPLDHEDRQKIASAVHQFMGSDETINQFTERILSGNHDDLVLRTIAALLHDTSKETPSKLSSLSTVVYIEMERLRCEAILSQQGQPWVSSGDHCAWYRSPVEPPSPDDRYQTFSRTNIAPYPPCIISLGELEPIGLADLRMETHHRGMALIARRVGHMAFGRTRILGTLVDAFGRVENFELYNMDWTLGEEVMPRCAIVIKEPYLTLSLEQKPVIRVDHPTDIVSQFLNNEVAIQEEADDRSPGIQSGHPPHNRCFTAASQADAGDESTGLDAAEQASRMLQQTDENQTNARSSTIEHDEQLNRSMSGRYVVVSHAERKMSPGRGKGLFATKDLNIGDLVICERPLCSSFSHEPAWFMSAIYDVRCSAHDMSIGIGSLRVKAIEGCVRDPALAAALTTLSGRYSGLGTNEIVCDGVRVVNSFQIGDIVSQNAFQITPPRAPDVNDSAQSSVPTLNGNIANAGIYWLASMINHSCLPNANYTFHGDQIVVRATKLIR